MKLLVVQNKVAKNIIETIRQISSLLENVDFSNIDFIIFPEMFTTPYEEGYFRLFAQDTSGKVIKFLKELSLRANAYIIGGTVPEKSDKDIFNTSYIFDRTGEIIAKYRKIHLFSIKYPNGEIFDEAKTLSRGKEVVTFDTEFGTMGIMICFDIRYPEQASQLQKQGVKVIFVPAAFNTYTGPLHWETTFRARAIDNQLFMVGASPSRESFGNYSTYGHSLCVDPYGKVIRELNESTEIMDVEIDLELIDEVRTNIPIIKNKIGI